MIFLVTVVAILLLSNYLYYKSTESLLVEQMNLQTQQDSEEIALQVKTVQQGTNAMDDLVGKELRLASLVVKYALSHDAAQVTNDRLKQLTKEMQIEGITLFQPTKDDIIGVKSSDPLEIHLSTRKWKGWYTAFQQLLQFHNASISFGKSLPNYWTGPFANANSNTAAIEKWGYFDDGSTNYIIDPFVTDESIEEYTSVVGIQAQVKELLTPNPSVLAVVGYNAQTLGNKPISWTANGKTWVDQKNEPVQFFESKIGALGNPDQREVTSVHAAESTNTTVSYKDVMKGRAVLKTFVPVSVAGQKDVMEFVTDYNVIQKVLDQQFVNSLWISGALLVLVVIIGFFVSGYIVGPLTRITRKVEQVAEIQFDEPIHLSRNDEIGLLANQLNVMSKNLRNYTLDLQNSVKNERSLSMSFLGIVASGLIHELKHPIVAMRHLIDLFPRVQELDEKGQEVLHQIQLTNDHVNSVVREFSAFIKEGKMSLGKHNASVIVREAVQLVRSTGEDRNIQLDLEARSAESDLWVQADRDKLRQVLINVLMNAMDAIDESAVRRLVRVEVYTTSNDVVIDVMDTGHGIPKENWENIFMPFHTTKETGLGLGLALSNFMVLSIGGKMSVEKSDGEGTVMRVTLPKWCPKTMGLRELS